MNVPRSPGSTVAASELDDQQAIESSPLRADQRISAQYNSDSRQQTPLPSRTLNGDVTEDEEPEQIPKATASKTSTGRGGSKAGRSKGRESQVHAASNASIYTGNKVKHLKKDDGEPLWRRDIQYDFLKAIFEDERKVFTNSYDAETIGKQTFANIYIDAMARSSKTSKILRDKLLSEHEPAKNMAMVCLLVNLGRMNTTLNFFPEMRAQLRTYHAIPSLQAHQDPNSYKQLQDAPRLKSILKGASEDRPEPNTLEKIKEVEVPRTNPVNLIFVLAQYAPKVTELHFPTPRDFNDLIMRTSLSSKSRATAFLWLMWHYLESDFTEEGTAENPFGAGIDYGQGVSTQGVPKFDVLSEKQIELENVDTEPEITYGKEKMKERKRIIEADHAALQTDFGPPKRGPKPKLNLPPDDGASPGSVLSFSRNRPSKYESDVDSTRSTPPPRVSNLRLQNVMNTKRGGAPLKHQMVGSSSPAPHGPRHGAATDGGTATRRTRPLTAHQIAVEHNRAQRVNYILSRGLRRKHHQAKKARRIDGAIYRSFTRMAGTLDEFEDSEGEDSLVKETGDFRERGYRGLVQLNVEDDDFGEELASYAAAFRRMGRRLDRWEEYQGVKLGVMGTSRAATARPRDDETEDEKPAVADVLMEDEDLDDMDKELLGLGSDADDDDLDDVDKTLLGIGGDETEDEGSDGGGMDVD